MAELSDFEAALKEVVHAKRLSASKMNNLTEIALKSMQNDTQLVSILYRTHKALQPPAKVSGLYVFDALARAARTQVVKQGLTGDINTPIGNCATFLLKLEGVLEGLIRDMISTAVPESKEKTKKILDIWSKGSTFPPAILVRLKDVINGTEKDNTVKDPRSTAVNPPPMAPVTPAPVPAPVLDPQATLLALLTQAAAQANNAGQTPTNIAANPQMSVLQQLALKANLGNIPTPAQAPPVPVYSEQNFLGRPSPISPPSYRDEPYGAVRRDSRFDPAQDNGRNHGSFRGGFRGRGRGEGRGWDDRERYNKDTDRSPPRRARSSRSRSPPSRYRRDVKPYSPPRRPSLASLPNTVPPDTGKDEFGRDIRSASPSPLTPSAFPVAPLVPTHQPVPPPPIPMATPGVVGTQNVARPLGALTAGAAALTSNHDQMLSLTPSVDANTAPDAHAHAGTVVNVPSNKIPPGGQGLENFSLTTFDFTAPSSWDALGKMWQFTKGYAPSQNELLQFVMSGGIMPPPQQQQQQQLQSIQHGGQTGWVVPRRGGMRGRGGFGRGRGHYGGGGYARDGYAGGETDAIVLGGGDEGQQ
ncbi:hypothetical protein FB45DRAFT_1031082 [Roridomyces roridus]|uniref:CID domain-containing protein n=1 Tax=Roridomyces roridus TaxID=1738132 RepID=A0AAD7BJD8_9AGAR|nr:hypothetical protein FB45DRAFT_1031082 [Roridomyces roridus]